MTAEQLRRLDEGALDIGFVTGPVSGGGREQHLIHADPFVCVVPDSHRLAGRESIRLAELADEDFIHGPPKDWEHFHAYLLPLCRRSGFTPRIVQEAHNTAGILGLVACGMGVTILTECVRSSLGPGLTILSLEDVSERLMNVAVWKTEAMSGSKRLFLDYLKETV